MVIDNLSRKLELMYDMLRAVAKESTVSDIQLGILKDTWHSEFNEEIPDHILDIMKQLETNP